MTPKPLFQVLSFWASSSQTRVRLKYCLGLWAAIMGVPAVAAEQQRLVEPPQALMYGDGRVPANFAGVSPQNSAITFGSSRGQLGSQAHISVSTRDIEAGSSGKDPSAVFSGSSEASEPRGVSLLNRTSSQGSFSSLSGNPNRLIGLEILRVINRSGERLSDPWVDAQLTQMFNRFSFSAGLDQTLGVVMIEDPSINAFAVPGGLVGFHTGLILEADSIDEVAGVMAHETAHLSQDHFGRRSDAQRYDWLVQTLGLLGAALIGGGSEAGSALALGSQALLADRALSFSRAQESEADRVGLSLMRQSEYDAAGMPGFFEKLLQMANRENKVTAFLRSHPLSSTRVSDIRARLSSAENQRTPLADSMFNLLRLRVLALTGQIDISRAMQLNLSDPATRIGAAMVLTERGQPERALKLLQGISPGFDLEEALSLARAEALLSLDPARAEKIAAQALAVFPESLALKKVQVSARLRAGMASSDLVQWLVNGRIPDTQQLTFWQLRLLELQRADQSPVSAAQALAAQAEVLFWQNQLEEALVSLKRAQTVCGSCQVSDHLDQRYQEIRAIYREKSLL